MAAFIFLLNGYSWTFFILFFLDEVPERAFFLSASDGALHHFSVDTASFARVFIFPWSCPVEVIGAFDLCRIQNKGIQSKLDVMKVLKLGLVLNYGFKVFVDTGMKEEILLIGLASLSGLLLSL